MKKVHLSCITNWRYILVATIVINICFNCIKTYALSVNKHPRITQPCPQIEQKTPYANIYMNNLQANHSEKIYALLKQTHKTRYLNVYECDPLALNNPAQQYSANPFIRKLDTGCIDKINVVDLFTNPFITEAIISYQVSKQMTLSCIKPLNSVN